MATPQFHTLQVRRISPEAGGAVAVTLDVPAPLLDTFSFEPGQFLTLRALVGGEDLRRSYSICSARSRLEHMRELEVGIRPVPDGAFSNWAARELKAGDSLQVMPPDGRFTVQRPRALHRVGFAAGSGITPILSIMASTLEQQPGSKFTLVYGNRRMGSVMFNEALQDLKDRYPDRLTLVHILSRQAQDVDLLQGRIDAAKVQALVATLLPAASMDEVFICGPQDMIDTTRAALLAAGVPARNIRSERFTASTPPAALRTQAATVASSDAAAAGVALEVVLDGKRHSLRMDAQAHVLDTALEAGLDLPYSCKAGVCCTCRARVLEGKVHMDRNFTLEQWEVDKGFVLTCQARPLTPTVVVSYDER